MAEELMGVHRSYIDAQLRYVTQIRGVTSPAEYFSDVLGFGDVADAYHDYPLDLIYRVLSLTPADVMLVLKNPNVRELEVGLANATPTTEDRFLANFFTSGEGRTDRIRKMSRAYSPWMANWFVKHPGPLIRMRTLVEILADIGYLSLKNSHGVLSPKEYLSSPGTLLSTKVQQQEGVPDADAVEIPESTPDVAPDFRDIYVTELSKFRAATGTWPFHLEERLLQKYYLRNEIKMVNPRLVVAMGSRPGRVLTELASTQLDDRFYRLPTPNSTERFLLTLDHPSHPEADYTDHRDYIVRALKASPST